MKWRTVVVFLLAGLPGVCGDWSPRLAADYLDSRQKEWLVWPRAKTPDGSACLSCHTGLTYLLARPALGRALGEEAPPSYQTAMFEGMRGRLSKKTTAEFSPNSKEPGASQALGVESVMTALLLASEDSRRGALSKQTEEAFERMWSTQMANGAWAWNSYSLDPWEEPESEFYGASLAALAVGVAPGGYQSRTEIRGNVERLRAYLAHRERQPRHNLLALVWASTALPRVVSDTDRRRILDETLGEQQADGGWTVASLGPWARHAAAPPAEGSNAYATGLVAFVLQRAGVARTDPALARALAWLRTHQDRTAGYWDASSMNKRYEAGSIPAGFMRDAATAFASMALLEGQ